MKARFKLLAAALLCAAFGTAGAQTARDQARNAGLADTGSTALALGLGAVEMNPLGPVLAVGLKVLVLDRVESLPEEEQAASYAMAASIWGGATANNLCVAAAILTGGGFAPACIMAGVAWGMKTWRESEDERLFWSEGCPWLRAYAQMPDLKCVYTPVAERMAGTSVAKAASTAPQTP